ncbi:MAG: electron transfer flavoprotein subunit beta/FixA family protein [Candidatus Sumerlaeota bacterium]|nr:electron transfer flavoprotein subunit beta/FixA family protein [Candidatus Sumerlaeota bacterium]
MNIVVCIKQVPETTDVKINPETNTLIREGVASIVNPFDMYALEQALRIRDAVGGKVIVVTMGPPQAEVALKECVEIGADDIYLVSDRAFAGSDTWATGWTMAAAIRKINEKDKVDLIICGKQAIDGDTAQVGPGISEYLDWAFVGYVNKVVETKADKIILHRASDYGHDVIEAPLPAVLTVLKEIGEPRMPTLKGKMKAKKTAPIKLTIADLGIDKNDTGLAGSPTVVSKIFSPPKRSGHCKYLSGAPENAANELHRGLKEAMII